MTHQSSMDDRCISICFFGESCKALHATTIGQASARIGANIHFHHTSIAPQINFMSKRRAKELISIQNCYACAHGESNPALPLGRRQS
jgi:hypothetical protein